MTKTWFSQPDSVLRALRCFRPIGECQDVPAPVGADAVVSLVARGLVRRCRINNRRVKLTEAGLLAFGEGAS